MRFCLFPVIFILTFLTFSTAEAQSWSVRNPLQIEVVEKRDIIPDRYITYEIESEVIKQILSTAPDELTHSFQESNTLLTVGLADGTTDVFRMVGYSMMESELSAEFPEIKTYRGISTTNPYRMIRADWTYNGFRAVIRDENGMTYIDPFQRNDITHTIAYYKTDFSRVVEWTCGHVSEGEEVTTPGQRLVGDCMFRSYRFAVATTGEYSNFFGATSSAQSAIVLAEVVTAVNRVNEVYESDVAVRLILIGNTASVFYYDPGTDPFSGSACTQLSQNQTNMDNVIGTANYDLGHVFSIGSGGCASSGLCSVTSKARGATGLNPPTGDPFYIDYVAHEIGHQFSASHTFNGTAGSCSGNRVGTSAYEPGSGTTIMAYAGICGAQNIQPNSDDFFHARSLFQISNALTSTNCAAFLTFNNTAPVAASVPNYNIPISTPFVLTASATDANNDPLFYCWEQYDLEGTSSEPPASNDPDGPLFRSFNPVVSPSRYFPRLLDLTQNISPMWEVLPSVSRTMNFKMTVRDYHNVAGCTDEDDVVVTTTSTAGPFTVTSQNAGATWLEGSIQTITWNVANTTASPVSCANVDIRLSYDGGFTYPTIVATNEVNDGSATVTIPAGITTEGRVMVTGSNNIFFDINNQNINIEPGLPNYTLALNPPSVSECNDGTVQTSVIVGSFMGFTDPVTLSLLNPPPGAIVTFLPPIVIPGNNSTLTISNLTGLSGNYTPAVNGSSTTGIQSLNFPITLTNPTVSPLLTMPVNHHINADLRPTLTWTTAANATSYEYQVSLSNSFTLILFSGSVTTNQVLLNSLLENATQYYWRVRSVNLCGPSPWSTIFDFKTMVCESLMSTDVPKSIPSGGGSPTITSILTVPIDAEILDLNVIGLTGTHTFIDNLKFSLDAPGITEVLFWDRPCNNEDNFNINFDDESADMNWPCPPTNGLSYKSNNSFLPFDNTNSSGTWTLKVQDVVNMNGGNLTGWGLRVCRAACDLIVTESNGDGAGTITDALSCAEPGDTITLSSILSGQTINVGLEPLAIVKDITILSESPDISVTSSGMRPFEISPDISVELIGMNIIAGTSMTAGAIQSQGNLTLKNVVIEKNPSMPEASLIRSLGGSLHLVGNCSLNQ